MKTLILTTPIESVIQPEIKKTISEIIVLSVTDNFIDNVTAAIKKTITGDVEYLVLWEADQYNNIGDWTQAQAELRILELL